MTTVTQSPSPNKKNPDYSFQVKVGRGRADVGAHHRAIDVAAKLFGEGRWDGRGLLIVHEAYDTHAKMQLGLPISDSDFEFGEDSLYPRTAAADDEVEIGGRAWRVVDQLTTDALRRTSPRAAENWQRKGRVARCEIRLAHGGRRSYLADRFQDGSWSKPWRGTLIAN